MKIRIWAWLCFVPLTLLAGCKGFWDLPSTGSGGTTATTLSSGVFYVLNETAGQIVAYSISSGTLNKIGTYSVTGPTAMAIAPNANFLYVSTAVNGIFVYNIGSGGALTVGNNGQAISSDPAAAVVIDTTNSWLIDTFINGGGQVVLDAIPLNSSGTYTSGATVPQALFTITSATVKQMALSSDDTNIFVALGSGGTIVVPFTSSGSSQFGATATTIAVSNTGGAAQSVAVDPLGQIFYIGETDVFTSSNNPGGLRAFNYSSLGTAVPRTAPTQISGSPIASGGIAPYAILPLSAGGYVYVANGEGNSNGNVAWFPITTSGTTYTIAAGSSINAGILPVGLAEDNKSNFVLAVSSSGSPDLDAFTMSSGVLTSAIQSSTGTDPVGAGAIAALP